MISGNPKKKKNFTYTRPWMYPLQQAAVFSPKRFSIIEATTKAGKTVGCLIWITEQAMSGLKHQNFWWVSPIFAQAKIAYRRLKAMLPKWCYKSNESEMTITLANGTMIWFKSGDNPDSLYGEDVFACVIDEASRVKDDSWYAVRSTLTATRGHCRIIGNVKGRGNWFYKVARTAESSNDDEYAYFKITANDAIMGGVVDAREVESARKVLPEHIFKMLYEAQASDDDGNPFKSKFILGCTKPALSIKPTVCFGIDLAKSTDWTVVIGLDAEGNVTVFERWQAPWLVTQRRIISLVGDLPALVDSTGVGDVVLEGLQRDGGSGFEGFTFSSKSKQQIMEGLQVGLETFDIGFPEGIITSELGIFEYEFTRTGMRYSAPAGMHDDSVCALALAYHKLIHNTTGLLGYYAVQVAKEEALKKSA